MENASITQRYKVLESENKLLLSETEQLRDVSVEEGTLQSIPNKDYRT